MNTSQNMEKALSVQEQEALFNVLKTRFEKNSKRHPDLTWASVQTRLDAHPEKLRSLYEMEQSGGEPDAVGQDQQTGQVTFMDCSAESPAGRRSLCYDQDALEARKKNKPDGNAMQLAEAMGIEMLNEADYRALQKLGEFDLKTSSWITTPSKIRKLGGALFCDRRYDTVFVYHNGADSYYAARGFRGLLRI